MVLAGGRQRIFAEVRVKGDQVDEARERAPLSMVIVLDASGSMSGEKLIEAKRSVVRMLEQMRPDDEVAFVRYDSSPELLQPMARVSSVRSSLIERVQGIEAGGGTNIPAALSESMRAVQQAGRGRVQRVVLVSDGLDSTRNESERIASDAGERGVTVSSLGIGLGFDEAYLASVARMGHGNFGFVENAGSLARFLDRELTETASTTVERAELSLSLPAGLRFVRAIGAEASKSESAGMERIQLRLGSLFSGDERRVVVELEANAQYGDLLQLDASASWDQVGGEHASMSIDPLRLTVTDDAEAVSRARDARVYANSMSAVASARQLEATEAYGRGDTARAQQLIDDNLRQLAEARAEAPGAAGEALDSQADGYRKEKEAFAAAPPASPEGRAAAKRSTERDAANLGRDSF
jgi:Ca-activated chloride channel family protein